MRSAEELTTAVVDEVGLSDFGESSFRDGLDALLESVDRDARLDDAAATQLDRTISRRLGNRLRIEAAHAIDPTLAQQEIEGFATITGRPRTGTTALGNMLSTDTQFRPLRMWEQMEPLPPPVFEEEDRDPRRIAHADATAALLEQMPALNAMHLYDTDATVEDIELLGFECRSQEFTVPVLGYHRWWRSGDMTKAYAYHRRTVLLLQSRRPPTYWLFKSPYHCFHLEAIVAAYPNAKFVMTHRDPAKAVPSTLSLCTTLYPPAVLAAHDLTVLGRHYSEHLRIGLEQAIAARQRLGQERFLDVHHREFVADPTATAERVYEFLGLELSGATHDAMVQWQQTNYRGARGVHSYTAEQFGLTANQLRSDYAFYMDEYDVAREGT